MTDQFRLFSSSHKVLNLCNMEPAVSQLLDQVAEEIRADFVEYSEAIGQAHENNIDWWVTDIASRNTLASHLFLNCCRLVLVDKVLNAGNEYEAILVDSRGFKKVLERYLQERSLKIRVICTEKKTSRINDYFKRNLPLHLLYSILISLRPLWAARTTKKNCRPNPDEPLVLLDNFVYDTSFDEHGEFVDRYYPGLEKYLDNKDLKHIYYLPTYYHIRSYRSTFLQMRLSKFNFCIKEDYLKVSDYLFAFGFYWRAKRFLKKSLRFKGFDINPMLREQIDINRISSSSFDALLKYRLPCRLKENGIQVNLLINWFENHVIDHGLNAGFRRWYSDTPIRGYQCFPLSPYYLSLFPTQQEYRCNVIPTEIAVMGRGYIDDASQFCSLIRVATAPALRFNYMWENHYHVNGCARTKKAMLVALPSITSESQIILYHLKKMLNNISEDIWDIMVKAHPASPQDMAKLLWEGEWTNRLIMVESDMGALLNHVNLVISMSSSVCLETVARGLPLIVIDNPSGINQLYLHPSIPRDIWRLCYSPEDALEFIDKVAVMDESDLRSIKEQGDYIREQYFCRSSRAEVEHFFSIERENNS